MPSSCAATTGSKILVITLFFTIFIHASAKARGNYSCRNIRANYVRDATCALGRVTAMCIAR